MKLVISIVLCEWIEPALKIHKTAQAIIQFGVLVFVWICEIAKFMSEINRMGID